MRVEYAVAWLLPLFAGAAWVWLATGRSRFRGSAAAAAGGGWVAGVFIALNRRATQYLYRHRVIVLVNRSLERAIEGAEEQVLRRRPQGLRFGKFFRRRRKKVELCILLFPFQYLQGSTLLGR